MRVIFEKPTYNEKGLWSGNISSQGTILHWGVTTEEHNRGDGNNMPFVYTVVFVAEDLTGKVFEVSPTSLKILKTN